MVICSWNTNDFNYNYNYIRKFIMETWQIILAIIIVGLSIIMPIYYSSEKKKKAQQKEFEKIKKYGETINQFTRDKNR